MSIVGLMPITKKYVPHLIVSSAAAMPSHPSFVFVLLVHGNFDPIITEIPCISSQIHGKLMRTVLFAVCALFFFLHLFCGCV